MQNAQSLSSNARIAHLSDLHILAARPRSPLELSTRLVSFGRALDPLRRITKLRRALAAARVAGAGHFVLSGDLTEFGTIDQFETLAEVLHDEGLDPRTVTLLPGNHDAYAGHDAWARALDGPLAPFRSSSAVAGGNVVERDRVVFLPLDVACHQHFTRAAGELSSEATDVLERRVADLAGRARPVVIALHHSPVPHAAPWQWLHGLRGTARLLDLLARYPDVHIMHGHLHHQVDAAIGEGGVRILGAPAVVDDPVGAPRVRIYDVADWGLRSVAQPKTSASSAGPKPRLAA